MNKLINGNIASIDAYANLVINKDKVNTSNKDYTGPKFSEILNKKASIDSVILDSNIGQVRFSKHANQRLEERNIVLSDEQLKRLEQGTIKAKDKGIKESLVLVDNYAFIVNTGNKLIVTAMDSKNSDENVYTNIDGAVVI